MVFLITIFEENHSCNIDEFNERILNITTHRFRVGKSLNGIANKIRKKFIERIYSIYLFFIKRYSTLVFMAN